MSYAKQIVELVTLENLGECPLLRHGQAVDIALKADTEIAALRARFGSLLSSGRWRLRRKDAGRFSSIALKGKTPTPSIGT